MAGRCFIGGSHWTSGLTGLDAANGRSTIASHDSGGSTILSGGEGSIVVGVDESVRARYAVRWAAVGPATLIVD
jgi:hypothetical protein